MKTKLILLLSIFLTFFLNTFSQSVGINNDASTPNSSAMLDVKSANSGLLIPRISLTGTTDATTIANGNITSLLVYNTVTVSDVTPGYYYWDGSAWTALGASGGGTIGGSGTTNYLARWTPNGTTLGIGKIQDNGSTVGINAAPSASYNLYNNGSFYNNGLFYTNINSQTYPNADAGLSVQWNFNGGYRDVTFWNTYTNAAITDEAFVFRQMTGAAAHNDIMMLMAQGNVGIGTVPVSEPPRSKLEICGTSSTILWDLLRVENTTETGGAERFGAGIKFHNTPNDVAAAGQINRWAGIAGLSEDTYGQSVGLVFYTNSLSVAPTEKMRITNDGKVGINTTSPGNNQLASIYNDGSFTGDDGSIGVGVFGSATQSENIYGVLGEAILTNWNSNDLITGVHGNLSWGGTVYAKGYLAYNDSDNDMTGKNALVGVLGWVNQNNNVKNTISGCFLNENNGSGSRTASNYALFATSNDVDANASSVNYGIYAKASGATTNYAGYFDGDIVVGTNGTAISNIIKRDIAIDPPSIGSYAQTDVSVAFTNAVVGSTVMVSPSSNSHDGLIVCFAYVSSAGNITIRFMNGTGGAIDGASINYHITVIE